MTQPTTTATIPAHTDGPGSATLSPSALVTPPGAAFGPWLVLLLAVALRFPILLITKGLDYWFYLGLGRMSDLGFYPYLDYWLEYPPVFPWLAVAAYRLTLRFPPTLYEDFEASYHIILGSVMVAADVAIVALIGALAGRLWPRAEAERRMLLYTVLFWPIVVAIGWYDALPCAMLLLGLHLLLRGQGGAGGAVAGLGFMTKIFPVLLVPVAVKFLPRRRDQLRALLAAAAVTLVIGVPLLVASPTYFVASYRAVLARSAWETVYALLDGYYSYGKVAPLGVRFDPSTAGYVAYRPAAPALPVALLFAALFAALWFRPVPRTPRNIVLFTALSTLLFLLYSKGYSPQFIIYLLPFVIVTLPWRRAIGYTLALSAVNLLEWPLYHEWLGEVHWVLAVAVVARALLWLALGAEWLAELWSFRNPLAAIQLSRRTLLAATTAALLVALPAAGVAVRTWERAYYNGSDLKPAFDFVRRHAPAPGERIAFVFADDNLYEKFYPYFATTGDFYLLRPESAGDQTLKSPRFTPAGRRAALDEIARDHVQIVFIRAADDWTSRDLNAWLLDHQRLAASARVANADLSVWRAPIP